MENFQKIRDYQGLSKEDVIKLLEERSFTQNNENNENLEAFLHSSITFGEMPIVAEKILPYQFSRLMMLAVPYTVSEYLDRMREVEVEVSKIVNHKTEQVSLSITSINKPSLIRTYLFFHVGKDLKLKAA